MILQRVLPLCLWILLSLGVLQANPRPNIVFLLVDDWRWDAVGCMGNPHIKTPHIDSLGNQGTVFKNAFVTTSICAVSRASIFTGQWQRRHGIADFATSFTPEQWAETYPALLKKAGYRTGFVGKLGVGDPKAIAAMEKDFDYWNGLAGQGGKHFIDPDDPTRKHLTAKFGDAALEFVETTTKDQPFLLSVSFSAVHARDRQPREFEPDPRDEELYKDVELPMPAIATEEAFEKIPDFVKKSEGRTRWGWRYDEPNKAQGILKDYYRLVSGVDREVGRLVQLLKDKGLADNTVIIMAGDNGFAMGDRGLADKWFMWEEDIRVPCIIYDPRTPPSAKGRRVEAMTLNVDIAPTFMELAGVDIPQRVQGRSLLPLIHDEQPVNWRTEFFYEHVTFPKIIPPVEGVRTKDWKYIRWIQREPVVEEFYDLKNDPLEQNNLVNQESARQKLEELRTRWKVLSKELE